MATLLMLVFITCQAVLSSHVEKRQATCANCVPLPDCPVFLDLLRSRNPEGRLRVRNAICRFMGRTALVCCPASETPTNRVQLPASCGNPLTDDRIIGGEVAPIGVYPWMAALAYAARVRNVNASFLCSGTVINERYVLTAAHCVHPSDLRGARLLYIHLGDWDLSRQVDCEMSSFGSLCAPPHIVAGVEEVVIHPMYNQRAVTSDDIALVRLNITLDFENGDAWVFPVCLPQQGQPVEGLSQGRPFLASGWGFTENGSASAVLLRVRLPLSDKSSCKTRYPTRFVDKQLCVGGVAGRDTCSGDSGGPIVLSGPSGPPFLQVGIVSYGVSPCGRPNASGVYTEVAQYITWITQNMKP